MARARRKASSTREWRHNTPQDRVALDWHAPYDHPLDRCAQEDGVALDGPQEDRVPLDGSEEDRVALDRAQEDSVPLDGPEEDRVRSTGRKKTASRSTGRKKTASRSTGGRRPRPARPVARRPRRARPGARRPRPARRAGRRPRPARRAGRRPRPARPVARRPRRADGPEETRVPLDRSQEDRVALDRAQEDRVPLDGPQEDEQPLERHTPKGVVPDAQQRARTGTSRTGTSAVFAADTPAPAIESGLGITPSPLGTIGGLGPERADALVRRHEQRVVAARHARQERRGPARAGPLPLSGVDAGRRTADEIRGGCRSSPHTGAVRRAQAERLLWRAGFGPRKGEAAALARLGLDGAVHALTNPGPSTSSAPRRRTKGPAARAYDAWGHDHVWWLDRMVRTSRPLVERMALVWHDWFATSNDGVGSQRLMLTRTNSSARTASGRFRICC